MSQSMLLTFKGDSSSIWKEDQIGLKFYRSAGTCCTARENWLDNLVREGNYGTGDTVRDSVRTGMSAYYTLASLTGTAGIQWSVLGYTQGTNLIICHTIVSLWPFNTTIRDTLTQEVIKSISECDKMSQHIFSFQECTKHAWHYK